MAERTAAQSTYRRVPLGSCRDCGVETRRRGTSGPHPKRCDEHAGEHQRRRARELQATRRAVRTPGQIERDRTTYAAWYARNAEQARAQSLQWYYENADRARETNARWYRNNVNKSRAKARMRRCIRQGVDAELFTPVEIYDRDGWICWLCELPVEQDCRYPDLRSPSLDHVVPISQDGPHTRDNVRLAHLVCNIRRGAAAA